MADAKLTALTAASALAAADLFYVSQSAASRKATGTQLLTLVGTAYVPLAGGTMTGALTLPAGAVGTPSLMFTGAGATTGVYSAGSNDISFAVNGSRRGYFNTSTLWLAGSLGLLDTTGGVRFGSASNDDPLISRQGAATLQIATASSTVANTVWINTYSGGASNYERLTLTGVAGSSVNITAETLGTGGDNLDIVLTPAGTGRLVVPGGSASNPGIAFSGALSTGIFSTAATNLQMIFVGTTGLFTSVSAINGNSGSVFGWASTSYAQVTADTGLARNAAGIVEVNNGTAGTWRDLKLRNLLNTEYHQMTEMTAPSAPATNSVRIYAEDNGSGKTRLMALFATGAAQQIAIEP